MSEDARLLTYCGFYCGDCMGYTGVIADAAARFEAVLDAYKFDRTAKCIFPQELAGFDRFREMLGFMTGLRCPGLCRSEGKAAGCEVKNCCIAKGFYACYECDDLETCDVLKSLHEGLHYDASMKNLRAIRKIGLGAWMAQGERHCYWLEENGQG
ncbi:MAG: DUF3795 domain-containing protein [Anaerolineae bacterium]|nr:DUF3795 domain-containing protein [Anaerolineae bacterium]